MLPAAWCGGVPSPYFPGGMLVHPCLGAWGYLGIKLHFLVVPLARGCPRGEAGTGAAPPQPGLVQRLDSQE